MWHKKYFITSKISLDQLQMKLKNSTLPVGGLMYQDVENHIYSSCKQNRIRLFMSADKSLDMFADKKNSQGCSLVFYGKIHEEPDGLKIVGSFRMPLLFRFIGCILPICTIIVLSITEGLMFLIVGGVFATVWLAIARLWEYVGEKSSKKRNEMLMQFIDTLINQD
jgi:hypothetical protein